MENMKLMPSVEDEERTREEESNGAPASESRQLVPQHEVGLTIADSEEARLWALWSSSSSRDQNITSLIADGLSPEEASVQADAISDSRGLREREGTPDDQLAAYSRECDLAFGLSSDETETKHESESESGDDAFGPSTMNSKDIWNVLCEMANVDQSKLSEYFEKVLSAEEEGDFETFREGFRELFLESGASQAEADAALNEFCRWHDWRQMP
jgi:hypothetical protein